MLIWQHPMIIIDESGICYWNLLRKKGVICQNLLFYAVESLNLFFWAAPHDRPGAVPGVRDVGCHYSVFSGPGGESPALAS